MQTKHWLIIPSVPIVVALGMLWYFSGRGTTNSPLPLSNTNTMQLTSTAFTPNGLIPAKFTCDGANISPELKISGVPSGAKSLVLIMDDSDIPDSVKQSRGIEVFDHWVLYNLLAEFTSLTIPEDYKNTMKVTSSYSLTHEGLNSAGKNAYTGPCPPDREHCYFFKLYALDIVLDLAEGSTKVEVETAMVGHILEQVELVGRYERVGK